MAHAYTYIYMYNDDVCIVYDSLYLVIDNVLFMICWFISKNKNESRK